MKLAWPKEIVDLGYAISVAEGFGADSNNVPTRAHNPGDLKLTGFPVTGTEGISIFPDDETGWDHLYKQLERIKDGNSHIYSPEMTFLQFARLWTDTSQSAWLNNVLDQLRKLNYVVYPTTTLREFFTLTAET